MEELTDGVKAVDVEVRWAPVSDMDLLQAVVRVVGQNELHRDHARLEQTWLPGEMVLGRQSFSCHVMKQLVGFHRPKR